MQSLYGRIRVFARHNINNLKIVNPISTSAFELSELAPKFYPSSSMVLQKKFVTNDAVPFFRPTNLASSYIRTLNYSSESVSKDSPVTESEVAPRIKFKRLDKTAKHIMQILDKEAVAEVRGQREIPDIKPGYIIQLKVEVPENKRRNSLVKGIVIARRNAGLNTTIRLRRMVAGVGVESLLPLYSPNIKEIKILDKKKVRRAKLYYLRDKLNPLKK